MSHPHRFVEAFVCSAAWTVHVGGNHSEICAGCMVSCTTAAKSSRILLKSTSLCRAAPKSGQDACRVIFAPVEATINSHLNKLAQGLEEGRDEEGGDHDRYVRGLMEEPLQERFQSNDATRPCSKCRPGLQR